MDETIRRFVAAGLGLAGTLGAWNMVSGPRPSFVGNQNGSQVFLIDDAGFSDAPLADDWSARDYNVACLYPSPDPTRFPVHGLYIPEPAASAPRVTVSQGQTLSYALSTTSTAQNITTKSSSTTISTTRKVVTGQGVTYRIPVGGTTPTTPKPATTTPKPATTTKATGNKTVYVPEDYRSTPAVGSTSGGRTVVTVEDFSGSKGGDKTSSGFVCDACPVVFVPEDWGSKSPPTPTVNEHCPTYDVYGYDEDGYNREGYSRAGYDRDGYDREGYSKAGYDRSGYDRDGYTKAGYDSEGYDRDGWNKAGKDRDGNSRA